MKRSAALLMCLATLLALAASGQKLPQEMTFPSGRKVLILRKLTLLLKTTDGSKSNALVMQYQTRLDDVDGPAMQKEIDELWQWLRKDAEYRKMESAGIDVLDGRSNDETPIRSFWFTREPDGSWKRSP